MRATSSRTVRARPDVWDRSALLATEVLTPWVWVVVEPFLVAWHSERELEDALLWGALLASTGAVVPLGIVVHGARSGKWETHRVHNRDDRLIPFLAGGVSISVGWSLMSVTGAPGEVIALGPSMVIAIAVCIGITFGARVKVSIHATAAVGAVTTLVVVYGPLALLISPLAALVCWSRVHLGDHTTVEVFVGAVVGVVVGGACYWAIANVSA